MKNGCPRHLRPGGVERAAVNKSFGQWCSHHFSRHFSNVFVHASSARGPPQGDHCLCAPCLSLIWFAPCDALNLWLCAPCRTEQTSGVAERSPFEKESAGMAKEKVRRGCSGSTIGQMEVGGSLDFWGVCPAAPLGPWAPVQCSARGGPTERPVPLSR